MIEFVSQADRCKLKTYLLNYINHNCIVRAKPGTYIPGKNCRSRNTWQFYLRKGLFNPEFSKIASVLLLDLIQQKLGHLNFQLSGLETAAIPLLVSLPAIAFEYDIYLGAFSVRKTSKKYGVNTNIEGRVCLETPVLLIDDLCNSGNSLETARYKIKDEYDLEFLNCVVSIVSKNNDTIPSLGQVYSLFKFADFDLAYTQYTKKYT